MMNKRTLFSSVILKGIIVLSAALFSTHVNANPSNANQLPNVNFVGSDIGVVWNVEDPGRCEVECKKNNNCKAWTWVKPGAIPGIPRPGLAGFCALKGAIPNRTPDSCCVSGYAAEPTMASSPKVNYLENVNFVGSDIDVVWNVEESGRCEAECQKNNNCKAWTWVKPGTIPGIPRPGQNGFCALKGAIPNRTPDSCCVSGVKRTPGQDIAQQGIITGYETADLQCGQYAKTAAAQNIENLGRGCGFQGPRWNSNHDDHFGWCTRGENKKYAEGENRARQDALSQCKETSTPKTGVITGVAPAIETGKVFRKDVAKPGRSTWQMPQLSSDSANIRISTATLNKNVGRGLIQNIDLQRFGELIRQVQSREGLADLSRRSGISKEGILFLAHEMDLRRTVGSENITPEEMEMLKTLEIESVRNLARIKGNEAALHFTLSELAKVKGIRPPSLNRVTNWVRSSSQGSPSIPPLDALLPWMPQTPSVVSAQQAGGHLLGYQVSQIPDRTSITRMMLSMLPKPFALQHPGEEFTHDFPVSEPGLYRADVSFDRSGGFALLEWQVEKPVVVLHFQDRTVSSIHELGTIFDKKPVQTRVTHHVPIVSHGSELNQAKVTNSIYFWINRKDLSLNGLLRFKIRVKDNTDYRRPTDPIEQGHGRTDPVIRGNIVLGYQEPIQLSDFNSSVKVPMGSGLLVVETPLFQLRPGRWQKEYGLSFEFSAIPRQSKEILMKGCENVDDKRGCIKYVNPGGFRFQTMNVLRDESPAAGNFDAFLGDWAALKIKPARTGIYRVIVSGSGNPSFQQLESTGFVTGASKDFVTSRDKLVELGEKCNSSAKGELCAIEVRAKVEGGEKPWMDYIVELESLEVSDQSETGHDDNDVPPGEFNVSSVSILKSRDLDIGVRSRNQRHKLEHEPYYTMGMKYPLYPRWYVPHPLNIQESIDQFGKKRNIIFPKVPLASFSEKTANEYDDFSAVVTVTEEDETSFWQELKVFLGRVFKVFKAALDLITGDPIGALKSFYASEVWKSNLGLGEADDVMGSAMLGTRKVDEYGLRGRLSYVFPVSGAPDPNKMSFTRYANRGTVTSHKKGEGTWVKAGIRLRKRPALVGWMDVQLKEFTLRNDMDGAGNPTNVIVRHGVLGPDNPRDIWWGNETRRAKWVTSGFNAYKDRPVKTGVSPPHPPRGYQDESGDFTSHYYYQIEFWDDDPEHDTFLGMVSHTFYLEDFYKNAGKLPSENINEADNALYKEGAITAIYRKEKEYYVGEFTIRDPGTLLKEVKLVVYAHIFEGRN